jgi:hypothetical protein
MVRWSTICVVLLAGGAGSSARAQAIDPPSNPASLEFFEQQVRPVLVERCQGCHGPEKAKNELRLDSRAAVLAGGVTGPAVEPGKPEESLLVEAIGYEGSLKMPPKGKLGDAEVRALAEWVRRGASWPDEPVPANSTPSPKTPNISPEEMRRRADHWAFRPLRRSSVPPVQHASWCAGPVDRFVLAKLEASSLTPAPEADRRTVIRRLTYDLIGLPPIPDEIAAFVTDDRPDAYERLVDRLLASPHYGERWGRHWLDLVRYGETSGHEYDYDIPNAWRYRDYVIDALNQDLPYDQFVREHLAGDLLSSPRRDPATGRNQSIVATAFAFLGEGAHSPVDVREEQIRRIDNQIDVLGKTFLGLTLACARCHDHKFDPISQRDYYGLAGYFKSSRYQQAPLDDDRNRTALAELRAHVLPFRDQPAIAALLRSPATGVGQSASAPGSPSGRLLFADFSGTDFGAWTSSGDAFGPRPSSVGDIRLERTDNCPAVQVVPPGVAHSGLTADRLRGALRSPTFTITTRFVQFLAWGRSSRINLVVDGFEKIRDPIYGPLTFAVDSPDTPRWYVQDVGMWRGHSAYIELSDGASVDFGGANSQVLGGDGFLAVDEIWFSENAETPPAPSLVPPRPIEDANARLMAERILRQAAELPEVAMTLALADGSGEDEHVLIRGNPRMPGPIAPRGFLEVIDGASHHPAGLGSERLDLVERLLDPADPLPARVIVNRLWQHLFGRGLVPTPDDFGHMGQPPTHPELLDWLATELIRSGWSLKHVHRLIVLSHAYRMSSAPRPEAGTVDPDNRLIHRAFLKRLEAESLRDSLLAVSGRLDRAMHGPGVPPFLSPSMDGRGRPGSSGPLDGGGRRTVYLAVRRNFLSPFLLAFDFPAPASPMGRRNLSNVPAQALALLNDPFVVEQARNWANRVLAEPAASPDARIDRMFLAAFGRTATVEERASALGVLGAGGPAGDPVAWADLAHVLINVKEFSFVP